MPDIKHALATKTKVCTCIELYIYTQILTKYLVIMQCTDKLAKLLPSNYYSLSVYRMKAMSNVHI